ncbi:MAG: tRNA-dihydrouridine synthase family protein [Anaerolineaceae bacterium]|nr:tRNA-dihydrouridine synthase family protein [Anaerolineaceae bacterium]
MSTALAAEPDFIQAQPTFFIGNIPIFGRLILAPMDGISDPTFRWITRRLGSAYSISEFINTLDYSVQKHYQVNRLRFRKAERPFGFQLLDNDPVRMAEVAASMQEDFHPDFFDINMGCSTHRVLSRGAGAGLMRSPELIASCFRAVKAAVSVPVTGKMRLGFDETLLNYREVAEKALENGAAALAVHGRTAKMSYSGQVRWQPITELKSLLPIPVIGNGDVLCAQDAKRMLAETGCDAVMIGRAAKANPWVFSWRNRADVSPAEVWQLASYQLCEMIRTYPEDAAVFAFRKFIKAYLDPYELGRQALRQLLTIRQKDLFWKALEDVFQGMSVDTSAPNPWFLLPSAEISD